MASKAKGPVVKKKPTIKEKQENIKKLLAAQPKGKKPAEKVAAKAPLKPTPTKTVNEKVAQVNPKALQVVEAMLKKSKDKQKLNDGDKKEVQKRPGILKRRADDGGSSTPSSGLRTPPSKRVHFKSPDPSPAEDLAEREVLQEAESVDVNDKALLMKLVAELDGAGMAAFLEYVKNTNPDQTAQEALCEVVQKKEIAQHHPKKVMENQLVDAIQKAKELVAAGAEAEAADEEDGEEDQGEEDEGEAGEDCEQSEAAAGQEEGEEEEEAEEDEVVDEEEAEPTEASKALVKAAEKTKNNAEEVRNSSTMKTEWAVFMRQVQNKKVFPQKLTGELMRDKTNLFGLWLDSGRDWEKTTITAERRHSTSTLARKEMQAIKAKHILESLGAEKGKAIIQKRKDAGLYYLDEDWPDDEMETWIYMPQGRKLREDETVSEEISAKAKMDADKQVFEAMTGEDGILAPGALPQMKAASEAGQKKLFQLMDDEKRAVVKKPKVKGEGKGSEAVTPKTTKEPGSQLNLVKLSFRQASELARSCPCRPGKLQR